MQPTDLAIPILPCKSVEDTAAFYERLGFHAKIWGTPHNYGIMTRGTIEIHFFMQADLEPTCSSASCYIRVVDVDDTYCEFLRSHLGVAGIPRMDRIENKPWGMREFAVVDLNGNLIRIGQVKE